MKNITFGRVLSIWFFCAVILTILNSLTLRSSMVHSIIFALLGCALLIYPVYPIALENNYSKERCIVIIRGIAMAEIVLSFCMNTTF